MMLKRFRATFATLHCCVVKTKKVGVEGALRRMAEKRAKKEGVLNVLNGTMYYNVVNFEVRHTQSSYLD